MMTDILIREGTKEDLQSALELIRELALYEKAPQEVATTVEQMNRDGFGPDAIFKFIVATHLDKIIGIALYYFKYSTWKGRGIYLDDIIVTEQYRRKGVGTLLMDEMIRVAKIEKATKLEWQVLNWNDPAIEFYRKYQVYFDSEWINCMLSKDQINTFES
jgi:GNAT superfamily N-acetyltransferase